jgi:putative oxidoreductase
MNSRAYDVAGRILIGLLFLISGLGKLAAPASVMGYMSAMQVPGVLLWPAIALEVFGGMALIAGFRQREAAFALAAFTIVATLLFHRDFGNQIQLTIALKNIAIVGGLLMIARPAPAFPQKSE